MTPENKNQIVRRNHYEGFPVDSLAKSAQPDVRRALVAMMKAKDPRSMIAVDVLSTNIYDNGGHDKVIAVDKDGPFMLSIKEGNQVTRAFMTGPVEPEIRAEIGARWGFNEETLESTRFKQTLGGRVMEYDVWVPKAPAEVEHPKPAKKKKRPVQRLFGEPAAEEYKPRINEVDKSEGGVRFHGNDLPARQAKLDQRKKDIEAVEKVWAEMERKFGKKPAADISQQDAVPEKSDSLKREEVLAVA